MGTTRWPTKRCISMSRSSTFARRPLRSWSMDTCTAPAGTTTDAAGRTAGRGALANRGLLQKLEQRQALSQRIGLHGSGHRDVLLVQLRDCARVVEALQR